MRAASGSTAPPPTVSARDAGSSCAVAFIITRRIMDSTSGISRSRAECTGFLLSETRWRGNVDICVRLCEALAKG